MKTTKTRFRWRAPLLLLALFSLALAACGSSGGGSSGGSSGGSGSGSGSGGVSSGGGSKAGAGQSIRLRPQDFAESETLTEVYAMYLKAQGFETSVQKPDGAFRKGIYPALESDKADLVIDYTGSAATELAPDSKPSPEADATYTRLTTALKAKNLEASEFSKAEDKNALVVLKTFAEKNNLTKISDLKKVEDQVVFGGSAQCITREDCLLGYQGSTYGLKFKDVKTLDYGPPLAAGLVSGDIQAAQYQTTAPEIASGKFVVLKDDKGLLSADNIVPIFRSKVSTPELTKALNTISKKLTTEDLIKWNVSTDIDKEEPAAVAKKWLQDNGLL